MTAQSPVRRAQVVARASVRLQAYRDMATALDVRPGDTVVAMCAGTAEELLVLAPRVGPTGRLVAVDTDDRQLAIGARTARQQGVRCFHTVTGDVGRLPLPSPTPTR